MFAGNRISQDLIRFRGTVVLRVELASQKLHVGINDSAFRSVFPVFFPLQRRIRLQIESSFSCTCSLFHFIPLSIEIPAPFRFIENILGNV